MRSAVLFSVLAALGVQIQQAAAQRQHNFTIYVARMAPIPEVSKPLELVRGSERTSELLRFDVPGGEGTTVDGATKFTIDQPSLNRVLQCEITGKLHSKTSGWIGFDIYENADYIRPCKPQRGFDVVCDIAKPAYCNDTLPYGVPLVKVANGTALVTPTAA